MDPLHLLRDQKLQHALPLASAYAALWDHPPTSEALKRQRARLDAAHHEPAFTNLSRWGVCRARWRRAHGVALLLDGGARGRRRPAGLPPGIHA
jgi:hypothetical protein